jgi:histone-lysine N-methyltransferase SETMAR
VPIAKRERFEKKKVLLCVWWNYEGLIYYELVPYGSMINAEVYSQQLEKIYMVLLEKYPALVNQKHILLQQDNARPHTVKKTLQKIEELEGIELLPHPTFSPDLAPSYYYLFGSMAQFLRGKKFQSVVYVEVAVEEIFAS